MKRFVYISFFVLSASGFSSSAWSLPFGFGCCCPSPSGCVMCGTIPCDSSCAGAALEQMGATISQSFTQLNSAYQQRNQQLQTATNNLTSFQTNITTTMTELLRSPSSGILNSLDGFTSRITSEIQRNTKTMSNLSDNYTLSMIDAIKNTQQAELKISNEKQFGSNAQPISGDIGVDRSHAFKAGYVNSKQIGDAFLAEVNDFNHAADSSRLAMKERLIKKIANLEVSKMSPNALANAALLNSSDLDALKQQIVIASNYSPLPELTERSGLDSSAARYQIEKNVFNGRLLLAQAPFIRELTQKAQLVDPREWRYGYSEESVVGDQDKTSLYEALRGDIDGRLNTPGWFQNVSELTQAGLDREIIYIDTITNKLFYEILERRNEESRLLAIQAAIALNRGKPVE